MRQPAGSSPNPDPRRRLRPARLVAPLVFAAIVLLILSDRVPGLRDARERLLHPDEYRAREACHKAALAAAEQPAYARIVARGAVRATQGAHYVEGVRVGQMGADGGEMTFDFSCYVDPDGSIVKTHKKTSMP
ncbi:MAG TPA: hypothetical protein VF203_12785 [Burkholderiales bacterium]